MARKKRFLEGLAPSATESNPDDVIYRKGVKRPPEEEIKKELEKQEFSHQKIEIYIAGTIILTGLTRILGLNLSYLILLPLGAVLGVLVFFIDRKIRSLFSKSQKNS